MTDGQNKYSGTQFTVHSLTHLNWNTNLKDRETDILDNEMLNDDFGCSTGYENYHDLEPFLGMSVDHIYERSYNVGEPKQVQQPIVPPPSYFQSDYLTQTWVRQQQMVSNYSDNESKFAVHGSLQPTSNMAEICNKVLTGKEDVQRGMPNFTESQTSESYIHVASTNRTGEIELKNDDMPSSPTLDIDQSIEQLNKLILELDPTFEPIPTLINCSTTNTSSLISNVHNSALHTSLDAEKRRNLSQKGLHVNVSLTRARKLSLGQYDNGTQDMQYTRYEWNRSPEQFATSSSITMSPSLSKEEIFSSYQGDVDAVDFNFAKKGNGDIPPTPAFPIPPETPYVRKPPNYTKIFDAGHHFCSPTDTYTLGRGMEDYTEGITVPTSDSSVGASSALYMKASQLSSIESNGNPVTIAERISETEQLWMDSFQSPLKNRSRFPESDLQSEFLNSERPGFTHLSASGLQALAITSQDCVSTDPNRFFLNKDSQTVESYIFDNSNLPEDKIHTSLLSAVNGSPNTIRTKISMDNLENQGSSVLPYVIQSLHAQPPLSEKKNISEGESSFGSVSSSSSGFSSPHSSSTISIPFPNLLHDFSKALIEYPLPGNATTDKMTVKFVQDTSKFWYKPDISREQAIEVLKDKEPGSFIVRDSNSFRGAYGLAMKVATPPPSVVHMNKKVTDLTNELVRHFLIECVQKGVRLKGCPNEPYFGSLTALVYQHSITPLALPCKLLIPDKDPLEKISETTTQTTGNSATELLKQGAACNVWYLNSVEMESLTGYQAVQKALSLTQIQDPHPISTVVHFKVSAQGITLTDNQRKLFFRRHYPVNTVIFCALDPQERKWVKDGLSAKVFGFVARSNGNDNICHLFAEHDPEQPASAIVNFVSKVMIGSQKKM